MAFHRRAEGIILKYLYFLHEKDVIKDYQVEKNLARTLYMNEFKPKYNITKFSFSTMIEVMRGYGLVKKSSGVIHFKPDMFRYAITYYIEDHSSKNLKASGSETVATSRKKAPKKIKSLTTMGCNICNYTCSNQNLLDRHLVSEKHLERIKFANDAEEQDVHDVVIEIQDGHGGKPETVIVRQNQNMIVSIRIFNKSSNGYAVENIKEITHSNSVNLQKPHFPFSLKTDAINSLNISLNFNQCIFYTYPLLFKLRNTTKRQTTDVIKKIHFHVHSDLVDDLHPTEPYKRLEKANVKESNYDIIPGVPPPINTINAPLKFKLPQYPLPQYMVVLLEHDFQEYPNMSSIEKTRQTNILKEFATYSKNGTMDVKNYFHLSELRLYMEEYQMKIDIHMYDVDNQVLNSISKFPKNFLELCVPGLAEHRPSLLRGDSVYVQENKESKIKYEGIVNKVNQNSVYLGFSHRFADTVHVKNKKYSVSFSFNRVPLRAEHQAIDLTKKHGIISLLCPNEIPTSPLKPYKINWMNPDIKNNKNQQSAIEHILSETSRPYPYLIFGPPGTGKTVTVVEAILQIRIHKPKHNILVSAPSNFAADEIMKRLVKRGLSKIELFRYVAPSYSYDLIDTNIKPYTNFKGGFFHPPNNELLKYHIVVTTLVTASRLVNGGTPAGHFSYVFIDESGHATESETLIPIAGILTSAEKPGMINGQVVLAGDPEQLGPIIHSMKANSFGYGMSMLERFMTKCKPYMKETDGQYDDNVLTKLIQSYRSHPAILYLPNKLFYDGDLIPPENKELTDIAVGWETLPNPNFPVLFHSVIGKDEREANSPSFFNLQEIDVVVNYLQKLIGNRLKGMKIEEEHIGIITPYRKQVHKLQTVCRKKNWNKLMIGSVEQFQGQERLIIIVSTVRSRPEFSVHDEKFHLGFLKNPKRFNVAITRAKALVIVIGNPNILQHDQFWRSFIQYCLDNSAFSGTPFQLQKKEEIKQNDEENEDSANFSRGNI